MATTSLFSTNLFLQIHKRSTFSISHHHHTLHAFFTHPPTYPHTYTYVYIYMYIVEWLSFVPCYGYHCCYFYYPSGIKKGNILCTHAHHHVLFNQSFFIIIKHSFILFMVLLVDHVLFYLYAWLQGYNSLEGARVISTTTVMCSSDDLLFSLHVPLSPLFTPDFSFQKAMIHAHSFHQG